MKSASLFPGQQLSYTLAAEKPIRENRIVHTTGKTHGGGESGGRTSMGVLIFPLFTQAEITPTESAIRIEPAYVRILFVFGFMIHHPLLSYARRWTGIRH